MELVVGQKGYHVYGGFVEEFEVQEVKLEEYKVKSSYYTYSVGKEEVYATQEEATKVLQEINNKAVQHYKEKMQSQEDFIQFCIKRVFNDAHDPEYPDAQLVTALKDKYKEYYGKELIF